MPRLCVMHYVCACLRVPVTVTVPVSLPVSMHMRMCKCWCVLWVLQGFILSNCWAAQS